MYVCVMYKFVDMGTSKSQKVLPDLHELEIQVVWSHMKQELETKLWSSKRAARAFKHWVNSPGP